MTRVQYLEEFEKIKSKYPRAKEVIIEYAGSGDSFDCFENEQVDGEPVEEFIDGEMYDFLFSILEHSDANFNDDGCSGTITLHLDNNTATVDNYYYYTERGASGEVEVDVDTIDSTSYKDDDIIIKTKPNVN